MRGSLEVFSQRRHAKLTDPLCLKDVPENLTLIRMQQSFKASAEQPHRFRTLLFRSLKYLCLGGLLVAALLAGLIMCSGPLFMRANDMGRQCFDINPRREGIVNRQNRFAMVTCTDGGVGIPGRSFDGLIELVAPNKANYAQRHGYKFIDASDMLDNSRPPSWSKILAVRKHLPNFDWVFWNDVDSLVTNPEVSLEDIVASVAGSMHQNFMPDLIITRDVTGVNAGMFLFRNTEWSMRFLELWWNQTSFVLPFGQMKSGDNDALKFLLQVMPEEEFRQHVGIPQQCAFNSYLWRPSLKSGIRLINLPKTVWEGAYSTGDFMVHLAGLNDKKTWVQRFLQEMQEKETIMQRVSRKQGPSRRNYV